jgi:hypothetical protein
MTKVIGRNENENTDYSEENEFLPYKFTPSQEEELKGFSKTKIYIRHCKDLFNINNNTITSMIKAKYIIEDGLKNIYEGSIHFAINEHYKHKKDYPKPVQLVSMLQGTNDMLKKKEPEDEWDRWYVKAKENLKETEPEESKGIKLAILNMLGKNAYVNWFRDYCICKKVNDILILSSFNGFVLDEIRKRFGDKLKRGFNLRRIEYEDITKTNKKFMGEVV